MMDDGGDRCFSLACKEFTTGGVDCSKRRSSGHHNPIEAGENQLGIYPPSTTPYHIIIFPTCVWVYSGLGFFSSFFFFLLGKDLSIAIVLLYLMNK
jgi:hypothetical protein